MDFDKLFNGFLVIWIISAILGLGMLGVILWAIIRLVTKYT